MGRVPTPSRSYGKKLKKKKQYTCSKFASHFDVLEKKGDQIFCWVNKEDTTLGENAWTVIKI